MALSTESFAGTVLFADAFDYPDGSLTAVSGGNWTTHSGAMNELKVSAGRLRLSATNTEDASAFLSGGPYDSSSSTNRFYASFILRYTSLPTTNGTYFAHFRSQSATTFAGRIWAFTSGAPPGKFRLGISSTTSAEVSATHPLDLGLNTDYLVVTRLVNSNSITKLWINPTAETDFSVSTSEPPNDFTVTAYAFRQDAGEGALAIDDLRIGTHFTDVVPGAPLLQSPEIISPPRSQSVWQGDAVSFEVMTSADPLPSYQWKRNGTNLAGRTDSILEISNASLADTGFYTVEISNALDVIESSPAVLNVHARVTPAFSILNYNLRGNGVTNWSTNTAQIRAIGRQVQFLDPDILTFQEIPVTNNGVMHMEHFVKAFRPGFYLATNSSSDLRIQSVILSRFPIVASRSWLHGSDLTAFGEVNGSFTRDLFEAEIEIPEFPQPLHVFTVHLKSSQDTASARRRAAEASAVSNFFVTAFQQTNFLRPCILTGDLNEDLMRPPPSRMQAVERLANPETGLILTTPFHPATGSELTFSIQSPNGLTRRYDYILPCGLLWSNRVNSQLFRSDLLNPLPPNLFSNDTRRASDHLPVLMTFGNPYNQPFPVAITQNESEVQLSWPAVPGQIYRLESSSNLMTWDSFENVLLATDASLLIRSNRIEGTRFYRVRIGP